MTGRSASCPPTSTLPTSGPRSPRTCSPGSAAHERTPILEDESALTGVEVRLATRVTGLDTERRVLETEDGEELGYARLVVATGSTPAPLPGVDARAPVFLLRDLEQARALVAAAESAHTAVVVGSGFIGCEAAASLATRGVRTTLVTPEPAPQAARLGEWVGGRVAEWLRGLGVRLLTGVQVEAVGPGGTVGLDDGSSVEADLVLAAVGVSQARPFLEGSALLTSDDGHLVVDDTLRTSDPHVWAAGDVAEARHAVVQRPIRVEHWGDAVAMGELAGHNAAGARRRRPPAVVGPAGVLEPGRGAHAQVLGLGRRPRTGAGRGPRGRRLHRLVRGWCGRARRGPHPRRGRRLRAWGRPAVAPGRADRGSRRERVGVHDTAPSGVGHRSRHRRRGAAMTTTRPPATADSEETGGRDV